MKANELMIGDWAYRQQNDVSGNVETHLVTYLDIARLAKGESDFFSYFPIPLTEEILKTNGISTNGDTFFFNEDEDYVLELCYVHNHLCWTINCAEYTIMTFFWVHELQHALRLCGLTDLADNFKIE